MPTLHVLLIFVGIPLLVIVIVSLLVLAPSWVNGPRYRPGQPWEANNESFGAAVAVEPAGGEGTSDSAASGMASGATDPVADQQPGTRQEHSSGGASAGW